ncbi:putative OmpL-like beta-barrel porin-2 [Luteibacter rhizovicinus]|uniref:Putative OmpL-like beta-barrel porin-2 n=1 Tax=Luteibacter rhizovicinus TaxID=242606 RepID=A0A4R3YJW4_9GAMM|nr:outer membrane beta-barrel protein [Luteibacter rhizovicinus]TCV92757.1 putative OmpL-like beta-barrel porin-2 [Luteibacter rhizovicinus]
MKHPWFAAFAAGMVALCMAGNIHAETASSDCDRGLISRMAAAYREDAQPSAPGDAPPRRAMDAPLDSPPFPSSEWQLGGVDNNVGVPDTNARYPLEKALSCNALGQWLDRNKIQVYGWMAPSINFSSSDNSNYPVSYVSRPNRVEFDQFLLRIQRLPDTVQTDHIDWGFHFDQLYGYDYHYTAMKGVVSNQLLNNNRVNGYDPMIFYGNIYIPWVAQGMEVIFGRYLSLPDIEAQFSPNNYLVTHSVLYTVDAYTNMGILTTTKLNDQWTLQVGLHGGDDVAIWNRDARLTGQVCVRWVSKSNDDMIYPCVESYNNKRQTYNNLQEYVITWGHRFNSRLHMLTQAYQLTVNSVALATLPEGQTKDANAYGIVNYMNYELNPRTMLSFRNEFYNDADGQRTGYKTHYVTSTLGMTRWVTPDLEVRPEVRYDHASDQAAYDSGTKHTQWMAVMDVIMHF